MSCGDNDKSLNPAINCGSDAEKVTAAGLAFSQNITKANCEAYKNAVRDFYKGCENFYTGAYKEDLDEFLAGPCPN